MKSLNRSIQLLLLVMGVSITGQVLAETEIKDDQYIIFYHNDALGSPAVVTDHNGNTLWHEQSEPFGRARDRVMPTGKEFFNDHTGSRIGYTGHLKDSGSDLVYMNARFYDPVIGRFYSNDPVGFTESNPMMFNRYAYANNNPYKYIDPNGKLAFLAVVPWAASAIKASLFVGSAGVVGYGASQVYQAHSNTPDNWIYNSDSETPDNDEGDQVEKPLPEGLVGDQSHPNAGKKKKSTKRWTSGPLLPEHGGVSGTNPDSNADSDSWEDFLTLTGGNYDPEPTENGMIVGGNGIRYRPSTETHAPGIEIPANNGKPAEGLHYPND